MVLTLPFAAALALMLFVAAIGFATVWLAWGNNSCGWEDGSFKCPMTHFARDMVGWSLGFLGLLAAAKVAREAFQHMAQRGEP